MDPKDPAIVKYIDKLVTYSIIVLHVFLLLLVLCQVVTRPLYISMVWTEEVAMFVLCYLVFLGAAIGVRNKDHFCMEILVKSLPPKISKYLSIVNQIILMILLIIMLWSGILFSLAGLRQIFPVTLVSKTWLYIILPFSAVIMLYFVVGNLIRDIRSRS